MARVAVPTAKASVSDTPDGLVINIPAMKSRVIGLFIGLWLCAWAFGEFAVLRQLATGKAPLHANYFLQLAASKTSPSASLTLLVWLGAWTLGGCVAICVWLWNVAGHEIVSLTPASLAIRREILGFGWSNEYDFPSARNLRIDRTPVSSNTFISWSSRSRSVLSGPIAFDYGSKIFHFGGGVDEAEASHLIELLKSRYRFDSAP